MLLNAFEVDYVQTLQDANDMIWLDIPTIIQHLVSTYGQIKPEQLRELKKEVEEYNYNPQLPVDVLFNKIEFFADLTKFANKPLSDTDKVDIAYISVN